MTVSHEFERASARAVIRALRGLEQTAIMLEKWGPEAFPANEQGQVHFGRAMTDSAAEAIRAAWKTAIEEVTNFPDDEDGWIAERGRLRNVMLEAAGELGAALSQVAPSDDAIIVGHMKDAYDKLHAALLDRAAGEEGGR
jgi:hypothetical protein